MTLRARAAFAAGLGVFLPGMALAQGEVVTVTAAPPDPVGNAAFSVTKVDAAALRSSTQLDAALKAVPGLSLFRRDSSISANPTTQGVSLRAIAPSGAGRTLVTLDGVPQNDPFGGWVIWSALPAEDIGGASVVRGAGAGPYGAGALTGVIALTEARGNGLVAGDISGGTQGTRRGAASGGVSIGAVNLFASASAEGTNGFIPIAPPQRGAADDYLTLDARNASVRAEYTLGDTLISSRVAYYKESRHSGVVGNNSSAEGVSASLTAAHPETGDSLGWRLQGWMRYSDFTNTSSAIAAGRNVATLSSNQYATPSDGFGLNAALRGDTGWMNWEAGADARIAEGESREFGTYVAGNPTARRRSGGRTFVGGLYLEGAAHLDDVWLLTLGARADQWASTGGHFVQSTVATGAVTSSVNSPSRSGIVPTGRAGVRRDFDAGSLGSLYVRSAAYAGFRAPSLNELYRGFRLGNNFTLANAALAPEKLYGAEIGFGGVLGDLAWNGTLFYNRLHGAISNVTVGTGPGTFPVAGFLPAGGLLIQRQNVGNIDAFGAEGDANYRLDDMWSLTSAFSLTSARVDGGAVLPGLTGKRPSQAPRWTVTAGVESRPLTFLTLNADMRYESMRFSDDRNTLPVDESVTLDLSARFRLNPQMSFYLAAENVLNARVQSALAADGTISYAAPRLLRVGLSYAQ